MRLKALLVISLVGFSILLLIWRPWKPSLPLPALIPVAPLHISDDATADSLQRSVRESIAHFEKVSPSTTLHFGALVATAEQILATLRDLDAAVARMGTGAALSDYLAKNYSFYRSSADSVLITGYYEASLHGSRTKNARFHVPLYKVPPSLIKLDVSAFFPSGTPCALSKLWRGRLVGAAFLPYFTREEIDFNNALAGQNAELLWVDDPVEAFFLHIQGSALVELDDGSQTRVGYAESNGYEYKPIGKLLIDKQILPKDQVTMQALKKYLYEHPEMQREMFSYNPSYIFFHEVEKGPLGSTGAVLTPYRSIATDRSTFPPGALAYIETEQPTLASDGSLLGWHKVARLVVNQDTGGAIKGTGRVDLFTGHGFESEQVAGLMKQPGMLYFLLKN